MKAFFDPNTRVLKAWGFVASNDPGDIALDIPDAFDMLPGAARLADDGETIEDYVPPEPVPVSVSPLQIRRALRQIGLAGAVKSLVASLDEEQQEAWDFATRVDRSNEMLITAASSMGKSSGDLDNLFRLAVTM